MRKGAIPVAVADVVVGATAVNDGGAIGFVGVAAAFGDVGAVVGSGGAVQVDRGVGR